MIITHYVFFIIIPPMHIRYDLTSSSSSGGLGTLFSVNSHFWGEGGRGFEKKKKRKEKLKTRLVFAF